MQKIKIKQLYLTEGKDDEVLKQLSEININQFKQPRLQSVLPQDENESLFYQSINQQYQFCPGFPFFNAYEYISINYQLLSQVLYNPEELFMYLHNFLNTIFIDCTSNQDVLFQSYISLTKCIPDLFRDLGKELSQKYILNLASMLNFHETQNHPKLFQAGYECLVYTIHDIKPDEDILVQLCQYIYYLLYQQINSKYFSLLLEIPAFYLRITRNVNNLSKLFNTCIIKLSDYEVCNDVMDEKEEFYEQESDTDQSQSEFYEHTDKQASQNEKSTRNKYDQFTWLSKRSQNVVLDAENIKILIKNLIETLPKLLFFILRRVNAELHSAEEMFLDQTYNFLQRNDFEELNIKDLSGTVFYQLIILLLESKCNAEQILNAVKHLVSKKYFENTQNQLFYTLALHYIPYFKDLKLQQQLYQLIKENQSFDRIRIQLLFEVNIYIQHQDSYYPKQYIELLPGKMIQANMFDYYSVLHFVRLIQFSCHNQYQPQVASNLIEAFLRVCLSMIRSNNTVQTLPILTIIKEYMNLDTNDLKSIQQLLDDNSDIFIFDNITGETFYQHYKLMSQFKGKYQIQTKSSDELVQILQIQQNNDIDKLLELFESTTSAQIKIQIYQKLKSNVQSLSKEFIYNQVPYLSSNNGCIRINSAQLLLNYYTQASDGDKTTKQLLQQILQLAYPEDILQLSNKVNKYVIFLENKSFTQEQQHIILHSTLGLLYSRYQFIQENMEYIFAACSKLQIFHEQIEKVIQYFIHLFENEDNDSQYLDNYLTKKRDYEYNIYDDYQASQLKRYDNLMVLIPMFQNLSKSKQYFSHNVFDQTFVNQLDYYKTNIIKYGTENPTLMQLNSYQNISSKQFQHYFVKQIYRGFINMFAKYQSFIRQERVEEIQKSIVAAIKQHITTEDENQGNVLSYYLELTVIFQIKLSDFVDILQQILMNTKYTKIIEYLILAYHQATGSSYIFVMSQLYNKVILRDQLSNIKFQLVQQNKEFNYTMQQCMRFNEIQVNYENYITIMQALKYRKQKIIDDNEKNYEYFNQEFVVSIEDRKSFIKAIKYPLVFQLNYVNEGSLQNQIIQFIQHNYNNDEMLEIYDSLFATINNLDITQHYLIVDQAFETQQSFSLNGDIKRTIAISERIIKGITQLNETDIYIKNNFMFRLISIYRQLFEDQSVEDGIDVLTQHFIQTSQLLIDNYFNEKQTFSNQIIQIQAHQIQTGYLQLVNSIYNSETHNIQTMIKKLSILLQQNIYVLIPCIKEINPQLPDQIFIFNATNNIQNHGNQYAALVQSMICYLFDIPKNQSYLEMLDKLTSSSLRNYNPNINYLELLQHDFAQEISILLIFVYKITDLCVQDKIATLLSSKDKIVYQLAIKYFMHFDSQKIKIYINNQTCNYSRFHVLFRHLQADSKHSDEDRKLYGLMASISNNRAQEIENALENVSFLEERMVQRQLLFLFYAKPTGRIFTLSAQILHNLVITVPEFIIQEFYGVFPGIQHDIAIRETIVDCLKAYGEFYVQKNGEILRSNDVNAIVALKSHCGFLDVAVYHYILFECGGLGALFGGGNAWQCLAKKYTTTTAGRLLLAGCIDTGFTSSVLIPLLADTGSTQNDRLTDTELLVELIGRFCNQNTYFTALERFVGQRGAVHFAKIFLYHYRFTFLPEIHDKKINENNEEQLLSNCFYAYDPLECVTRLRQRSLCAFVNAASAHIKTGIRVENTQKPIQTTLYTIINNCLDYSDDFIAAVISLLQNAKMKTQIAVLQQKILHKTMSKRYATRQRARELLRTLYAFASNEMLSASLFSIKAIYKNNDMYSSVAPAVVASILEQLIIQPLSTVYHRMKSLSGDKSDDLQLVPKMQDAYAIIQDETQQNAKAQNRQMLRNEEKIEQTIDQNNNTLLDSEYLKQNQYLLREDEKLFILQQVLTTQQINVIYDIISNDLYSRSNIDLVHISKLIPEYNQLRSYNVISLVLMQYQLKDANIQAQFIYKQFIRLLIINSTKHFMDYIKLADAIVAGLAQNPSFKLQHLKSYLDFITTPETCDYCQLKPTTVMSAQDIKHQILKDNNLQIHEKVEKLRNSHLLLEKEPQRNYADTTRPIDGANYDANFCVYTAVTLIGHALMPSTNRKASPWSGSWCDMRGVITSNCSGKERSKERYARVEESVYNNDCMAVLSKELIMEHQLDEYLLLGLFSNTEQILIPLLDIIYYLQVNGIILNDKFINQIIAQLNQSTNNKVLQVIIKNIICLLINSQGPKLNEKKIIQVAKTAQLLIKDQYTQAVQQVYKLIYILTSQIKLQHNFIYEINDFLINHSIQLVTEDEEIITMITKSVSYYILNYKMAQENKIQKIQSLIKLSVEGQLPQSKVLALRVLQSIYVCIDSEINKILEQQIYISLLAANINSQNNDIIMKEINNCFVSLKSNPQRQQKSNYVIKYFSPMLLEQKDLVLRCRVLKLIQQLIQNNNEEAIQADEKYSQNTVQILHNLLKNVDNNEEFLKIHLFYISVVQNQAYNFDAIILNNKNIIDNENIFQYLSDQIKLRINQNKDNSSDRLSISAFSKNQIDYMVDYYVKEMINYDLSNIQDNTHFYIQLLNVCSENQFLNYADMFVQIAEQHYQYVEQVVSAFKGIVEGFIQQASEQKILLFIYQMLLMQSARRSRQQIQDGIQKIGQQMLNNLEHQILKKREDCNYQKILKRAQKIFNEQEQRIQEHKAQKQEEKMKQKKLFNKQFEYLDD